MAVDTERDKVTNVECEVKKRLDATRDAIEDWLLYDGIAVTDENGKYIAMQGLRYYIEDRKDDTMIDSEGSRHLYDTLKHIGALEGLVEVLVNKGIVELTITDEEKKPSILDEKWEWAANLRDNVWVIKMPSRYDVAIESWGKEIAALPDCLRVLVEIRDHTDGHPDAYIFYGELMARIAKALKKAGIE